MKKNFTPSLIIVLLFAISLFTISLAQVNAQEDYRKTINVGSSALWVQIVDDKVYVTNPKDGTIAIIDENTNKVINTIDAGKDVTLIEVVKDKNKIYTTSGSTNKVSVFDLETHEKLNEIDLGEAEITLYSNSDKFYGQYNVFQTNGVGLAYNPNNEMLYAVHHDVNHVNVIDTEKDVVVGTISVGIKPLLIEIDEETNTGFVTNWESNDVTVIDLNSNKVTGKLNTGFVPDQMAIDPQNRKLYVTHHASQHVAVIDLKNKSIETKIQLKGPTHAIAFNSKNDIMHVTYLPESGITGAGFTDRVELIDTKTNTVVGGYDIADNPFSTAIDSDRQRLYATILSTGDVIALDLSADPRYMEALGEKMKDSTMMEKEDKMMKEDVMTAKDHMDSPLKQMKSGVAASDVTCKEGLELIFKVSDGSAKCVSSSSASKLIAKGWATQ